MTSALLPVQCVGNLWVEGFRVADKPTVQAVLLCDGAMQVGRKWTLQGIFDRFIVGSGFPFRPPLFFVYCRLVGLLIKRGLRLSVEIRRTGFEELEEPTQPIFRGTVEFQMDGGQGNSPGLRNFDFAAPVPGATFPSPGMYDLVFLADGELLGLWALHVVEVPRKG